MENYVNCSETVAILSMLRKSPSSTVKKLIDI